MGIGIQPIYQSFLPVTGGLPGTRPQGCQSCRSDPPDLFVKTRPQLPLTPPPLFTPPDPAGFSTSVLPPHADMGRYYVNLGEHFYESNRFAEAVNSFTVAFQLNNQDYIACNKRGVARAAMKDYAGAMADYTLAMAIKPDFYNAYVNRGNLKVYVRDYAGALADYDQAVRLNPGHSAAYENRAEVYTMLGLRHLALRDRAAVIWIQKLKKLQSPAPGLSYCPKRVALVLWNDDYNGTKNDLGGGPKHDGLAMAGVLQSQGFQVITGANLTGQQMKDKVAEFIDTVNRNPGAVTLMYYSGHGGSINGNNYLIPVDYTGEVDTSFVRNAVSMDYLLKELKGANSLFNMIFLDACRTPLKVPPPQSGARRELMRHWESEPGPGLSNVWIEYASRPRMPALQDANSGLYTKYLLQYMTRPDLSLKEISLYTSFALEKDPIAVQEEQHSWVQSDFSRTEAIAEAFSFARPCSLARMAPNQAR
jgi:hypothetical protein